MLNYLFIHVHLYLVVVVAFLLAPPLPPLPRPLLPLAVVGRHPIRGGGGSGGGELLAILQSVQILLITFHVAAGQHRLGMSPFTKTDSTTRVGF